MTTEATGTPAVPAAPVAPADALGTPPAAPVPAASTAPPAKAEAPAAPKEGEVSYPETGNQKLDYALGIVGKAGIDNSHPAVAAALDGDFTLLHHALDAKGVPGAAALVEILKGEYEADAQKGSAAEKQIQDDVLAIAGDAETWNSVAEFIRENGDEAELNTLRGLLGDPATAKIAAAYMTNLYHSQGGEKEPQATVSGQQPAARASANANSPLSRAEFAAEAQKLHQKFGDRYTESREYAALGARLA